MYEALHYFTSIISLSVSNKHGKQYYWGMNWRSQVSYPKLHILQRTVVNYVGKLVKDYFLCGGIKNRPLKYFEQKETVFQVGKGVGGLATEC